MYEELEMTDLVEVEGDLSSDGLDQYQEDYRAYEEDLMSLIKEGK
jgi:hypothetical protein